MQVIREIYLQTPKGKLIKQDQPPSGSQIDRYHELDNTAKSIDDLKKYNDAPSDYVSDVAEEQKTQQSEYTNARSRKPNRQVVHDFVDDEEPVPLDEVESQGDQDLAMYSAPPPEIIRHARGPPSNTTTIQPFDETGQPEPATIMIKDNFNNKNDDENYEIDDPSFDDDDDDLQSYSRGTPTPMSLGRQKRKKKKRGVNPYMIDRDQYSRSEASQAYKPREQP